METVIDLPAPHCGQAPILDDSRRYKLVRAGRRWGKSRLALFAAIVGHGPILAGVPRWRGLAHGADILWLAPDYPQARAIWREEILPRFANKPGVTLAETERRVTLASGGSLEIRSAEAVDSIRGRGLDGVIVDEGAHLDLGYAWANVLRPALSNPGRVGWAILISSPNGGQDGNILHETPSAFNRMCESIESGELGRDWGHWHRRTRDNPLLALDEIEALYRESGVGSPATRQELDAELLLGGGGQVFPEFSVAIHGRDVQAADLVDWKFYGGLDWGYRDPSAFVLFAMGPEGDIHGYWDVQWTQRDAELAGSMLAEMLTAGPMPQTIVYDSAMHQVTGGGETVAERFLRGFHRVFAGKAGTPGLMGASKGPGSVRAQLDVLHGLLRYEGGPGDWPVKPWQRPKLTFSSRCANLRRTLPRLVYSLTNPVELADRQDDHVMQALAYGLQARPEAPRVAKVEGWRDQLRLEVGEDGRSFVRPKPPTWTQAIDEMEDTGKRFTFRRDRKRRQAEI